MSWREFDTSDSAYRTVQAVLRKYKSASTMSVLASVTALGNGGDASSFSAFLLYRRRDDTLMMISGGQDVAGASSEEELTELEWILRRPGECWTRCADDGEEEMSIVYMSEHELQRAGMLELASNRTGEFGVESVLNQIIEGPSGFVVVSESGSSLRIASSETGSEAAAGGVCAPRTDVVIDPASLTVRMLDRAYSGSSSSADEPTRRLITDFGPWIFDDQKVEGRIGEAYELIRSAGCIDAAPDGIAEAWDV